jgi:alpha-glucan,water dikinase
VPESARGYLGYVLGHVGDSQVLPLMEAAVEARSEIAGSITGNRELIYLDLALEDQVRQAAERGIGSSGFGAAAFMKPLLQNLCLSLGDNEELCYCLKTWQELPQSVRTGGRPNKDEALQAVAVVNRIR